MTPAERVAYHLTPCPVPHELRGVGYGGPHTPQSPPMTDSTCYHCGAPVVSTDKLNGLDEFRITPEMILRAAREMSSWSGPTPGGVDGFWPYAAKVLEAALGVEAAVK
jgi:hypothetical protein